MSPNARCTRTTISLDVGKKFQSLKRHLATHHDLAPEHHGKKRNLQRDYPMVAPDYAALRAELARKIGLGRKPKESAAGSPP